jgi:hypothetical protein
MATTLTPVTCKTRQQIADQYGFSRQTLWRKLRRHGIELPPGLICPKWQKLIYNTLGYPSGISYKDYEQV